jgi:succinyl-CoA synthetase beta subunit
MSHDLSLLEINPLALLKDGQLVALDCKITVDDNALFRQSFLARFEDYNELDPTELRAKRARLSYVQLDGNIGCLVNGAGLAMATMDAIVQAGGKPSNFLDIGGGVTEEGVIEALSLLLDDSKAQVLFINIFGGIVKCDLVASSVISAYRQSSVRKPCVIRLIGTNDKLAQAIFSNSEFQFRFVNSMEEGAALAVQLANR